MKVSKYFLVFFVLLIFIFRLIFPTTPRVALDFPYIYQVELSDRFGLPQTWSGVNAFGENITLLMWGYFANLLFGIGGKLGLDFSFTEKVLAIIPIFAIGFYSIKKFLEYEGLDIRGVLSGSALYLFNSYFLLLLDGGQLMIAAAYSIFPLCWVYFDKSVGSDFRSKVFSGLLVSTLGFLDIRFLYVFALLLGIKFAFEFFLCREKIKLLLSWSLSGILVVSIYITLSAFWLLPTVLTNTANSSLQLVTNGKLGENSFNIGHAILLLSPHWPKNSFGVTTELKAAFIVIPLLAFLTPLIVKKTKRIGFWWLVAIAGIFLTNGASGLLGHGYIWIYEHMPGFNLFRDSTKFFFLTAISYSFLIGSGVSKLSLISKDKISILGKKAFIVPTIFIFYLVFLARPVWLGHTAGIFSTPINLSSFDLVSKYLESDVNFGRILWISSRHPLGYASPNHPAIDGLRLRLLRPFLAGNVGSYELFNFIREAPFMGQMFDIASIKYIAYPDNSDPIENSSDELAYHKTFGLQLNALSWIKSKIFGSPINLFETSSVQDHFFLAQNTFYVIGSDRIYWDLAELSTFRLKDNVLVFVDENINLLKNIPFRAKIILYDVGELDLAANLVNPDNLIFPAKSIGTQNKSGWWSHEDIDLAGFRDFLHEKYKTDYLEFGYGSPLAVSEGENELTLNESKFTKGQKILVRALVSAQGGQLEFWQGDTKFGEVKTFGITKKIPIKLTKQEYDNSHFAWFDVGNLPQGGKITIKSKGNLNLVGSILSLSEGEWEMAVLKKDILKKEGRVVFWSQIDGVDRANLFESHNNSLVKYNRVSGTHYKISIKGLDSPSTLVFSEGFDHQWLLNGENSTKVWGIINGFDIPGNGEYDLYFSPQKYVNLGLIISLATIGVLGIYFLYTVVSDKKS